MSKRKVFGKGYLIVILLVLLIGLSSCSSVETISGTANSDPAIPSFTQETGGWIDTTKTVSDETINILKSESEAAKQDGFEIAGAIFNNCASGDIEFATEVGNENGIGDAKKDNGLLFAVYLEKEGNDGYSPVLAIVVGSGLESLLNDAKIGRFLDQYYVPERADGNWELGLINTQKAIHNYLNNPEAEEYKSINEEEEQLTLFQFFLIIVFGVIFIFILAFINAMYDGSSSGGFFSSSGGSGGSFGGGGGFSGGGGSR